MKKKKPVNIAGIATELEAIIDQPGKQKKQAHKKGAIGISISYSSGMEANGYTIHHLEDALTETARYLLTSGYHLVYGGDLRMPGFTYQLAELAKLYTPFLADNNSRVDNYLAWPLHLPVTTKQEADFKTSGVRLIRCPAPAGIDKGQFVLPDSIESRLNWAESLYKMRCEIVKQTDARIIFGGQLTGFKGRMPGVLEEVLLSLEASRPIYICGTWGGAGKAITDMLTIGQNDYMNQEWQCTHNDNYADLLLEWNKKYPQHKIDYKKIAQKISSLGLKGLSKMNGLSENENLRLFTTPHSQEMIYLILKGLAAIK